MGNFKKMGLRPTRDLRGDVEYEVVSRLYNRFVRLTDRRFVLFRTLRYRMILRKIRRAMGKD